MFCHKTFNDEWHLNCFNYSRHRTDSNYAFWQPYRTTCICSDAYEERIAWNVINETSIEAVEEMVVSEYYLAVVNKIKVFFRYQIWLVVCGE
jgi:hypothetical protein